MNFTTALAEHREAAFNSAPGRLKRIVGYSAALAAEGVDYFDAMEEIEHVLCSDERFFANRPAGRRAYSLAVDAASESFDRAIELIESAEGRAERRSRDIFDNLAPHASLDDFAAAVIESEPLLGGATALRIARGRAASLTRAPQIQRGFTGPLNQFAEAHVVLGPHEFERQRRACEMLGIKVGDDSGHPRMRIVEDPPSAPEAEEPDEFAEQEEATSAPRPDDSLLRKAMEDLRARPKTEATLTAEQALRRVMMGMGRPAFQGAQPVDLWQRYEAPDLPTGLLPAVIEQFAFGHAETMGADPAGLAMSALAVCAMAITDDIKVQAKLHDPAWRESPRLWVGLVGDPSMMKSPVIKAAIQPLRELDHAMAAANAMAMADYMRLPKKEQAAKLPPPQPQLIIQGTTVEALQEALKDTPRGILCFQDELSGFFGQMEKYNSGKGSSADRAFWLESFNGGPYRVNRVGRGRLFIPNISVGLLGGIQPGPLRKIVAGGEDDGLIQRFLPVMLRTMDVGQDRPAGAAVAVYHALVKRLAALSPPTPAGDLAPTPPVMLSAEARAVRERLERDHHELAVALRGISPKLASHIIKHNGIFLQLCLLFHCIESPAKEVGSEISGELAERVAQFMTEYLRPSAFAFYSEVLGMAAGHENLMAVASLIVSDPEVAEVSARVIKHKLRAMREVAVDELRRLLEGLETFGWLDPIDQPRGRAPRWRVVPEVRTLFEERARIEAERRAAAAAKVAEIFSK